VFHFYFLLTRTNELKDISWLHNYLTKVNSLFLLTFSLSKTYSNLFIVKKREQKMKLFHVDEVWFHTTQT